MHEDKPMPILLIEDDVAECIKFKDCVKNRKDVVFIGMTGSSSDGMKYVQMRQPEGVILDLELQKGKGTGMLFLADLSNASVALRPIIIITTNNASPLVYNYVRNFGVDFIFCKRQADYSPDMVINTLLALRPAFHSLRRERIPDDLLTIESQEELRSRIMERIEIELDLIGIPRRKGRVYLQDSIILQITAEKDNSESILSQVAQSQRKAYSSVFRAIQTAINSAWNTSSPDDLLKHYTNHINIYTGVPTPTEFISFYADKIRKTM